MYDDDDYPLYARIYSPACRATRPVSVRRRALSLHPSRVMRNPNPGITRYASGGVTTTCIMQMIGLTQGIISRKDYVLVYNNNSNNETRHQPAPVYAEKGSTGSINRA